MKVSVKTLDSVTRSFDVTPETTILEFKHIISPEISIDAEKIRFIFKGTVLDDTRTVTSCELEDATIHAVERLPQVPPSQSSSEPAPNPPPEENTMFRNTLVASEELSRAVQRILRTVQTTFLDVRGPTATVANRIDIIERFINHANSVLSNSAHYNSTFADPENRHPTPDLQTSDDFSRLILQLRSLGDCLTSVRTLIETYARFLEQATQNNSQHLIESGLYPNLPDAASVVLHSLSHALHNLSDILVHAHSNNTRNSPFRLVIPRISRHSNISSSVRRASSNNHLNRSRLDIPSSHRRTPRQRSSSNTNSTPRAPAITTTNVPVDGNNLAYHLTVQFSTDNSETISDFQPHLFIFNENFPTATANTTSQTPQLIRTTAGSSSSTSNIQPPQQVEPQTSPEIGLSSNAENQTYLNPYTPTDPYLTCHSFHANYGLHTHPQSSTTSVQSEISTQPNISQPPAETPPQPCSEPVPSTSASNTTPIHNWTELFPSAAIPVIDADVNSQKTIRKMPPFSDGYIAGSPNKKKKMEQQEESSIFFEQPLSQSFIQSIGSTRENIVDPEVLQSAIDNDPQLQQEFRDAVETSFLNTINSHQNIDPTVYPQCSRLRKKNND